MTRNKEHVSFINEDFIVMLGRLRSIAQHMAITITYKIEAGAGSRQGGEIRVMVFFVLCGVV